MGSKCIFSTLTDWNADKHRFSIPFTKVWNNFTFLKHKEYYLSRKRRHAYKSTISHASYKENFYLFLTLTVPNIFSPPPICFIADKDDCANSWYVQRDSWFPRPRTCPIPDIKPGIKLVIMTHTGGAYCSENSDCINKVNNGENRQRLEVESGQFKIPQSPPKYKSGGLSIGSSREF